MVGHQCSSSCTPAGPIYEDANITMIPPSCTAPALTDPASHVVSFLRTAPNYKVQGRVIAEFAYNTLGVRKAATIHDGSPYAEQLQQVFVDSFKELGGEITAQEAVIYNGQQFNVTRDGAQTWVAVPPDISFGETFVDMEFVNPLSGWVITMDPSNHRSLYRTLDGGSTWLPVVP